MTSTQNDTLPTLPERFPTSALWPLLAVLSLLWGTVIYQLSAQWMVYEQYAYGWAVPILSLYLIWKSGFQKAESRNLESISTLNSQLSTFNCAAIVSLIVAALLFLPTRIIVEANPIWRAASYGITLEVICITLALLYLTGGRAWLKQFAFPVLFFLVAVPWPSGLENFVIQLLTRLNTGATIEVLGILGIPALQHGNVIEISTGMVGIEEACSGIRSLQATLMISLFFGAWFRLNWKQRIGLCFIGFLLAFIFNIFRTSLLVSVASRDGIAAMEKWHDPAGVTILIGCFLGLWFAAEWMKKRVPPPHSSLLTPQSSIPTSHSSLFTPSSFILLLAWILSVEATTQLWFGMHERKQSATSDWSVNWPTNRLEFREIPISKLAQDQLKYSVGHNYGWREADETVWQTFYLQWNSARTLKERATVHLAKSHKPEICLTAIGKKLKEEDGVKLLKLPNLSLPYRSLIFDDNGRKLHVFFLAWEEGTPVGTYANMRETSLSRLQAAWDGSRGKGQRVMEFAVWGLNDLPTADRAFQKLAAEIISR